MAWDNESKDWDYYKPLHRIHSASYNPGTAPVDGRGYPRGCHAGSDGPNDSVYGLIIRDLARAIPGWVSVTPLDAEQELEGSLERCFQTWTDVPLFQWHRFYDWNFHVTPADGYTYVMGAGNHLPPEEVGPTDRRMTTHSMECEWDCGAFGERPGVMFNNDQWLWPQTGQYCWMAGRWIYDCGHASSPNKQVGLMRSELHPVKAMATAQWEAVKFPENGNLYVPGIRFLFFASKRGGYKAFDAINDQDYEFILDLPKRAGMVSPWLLGHTPDFPLNTGVLRAPNLLHSVQFLNTGMEAPGNVQPTWEAIPAKDPGQLPEQIKLKIPLTQLAGDIMSYGVILNFGWLDPDQSQARRVKRCKVRFTHLHKANVNHDVGAEEWMIKFGVNGRWYTRTFNDVHNNRDYPLNVTVPEFYLADIDSISISSHGAELDQMDDVFYRPLNDRTLHLYGNVVDWERDVIAGTTDPETNTAHRRQLWDLVYAAADMLPGGDALLNFIGIEDGRGNNPLGIIDPGGDDPPPADPYAKNPLPVRSLDLEGRAVSQTAFYAQEVGESAELVEHRTRIDYVLHYELTVQSQLV